MAGAWACYGQAALQKFRVEAMPPWAEAQMPFGAPVVAEPEISYPALKQ
jgi:hypothetical protein